jgi:hypothetical protein
MSKFESISAWKKHEIARLDNIEYSLYIVRNELELGTEPVASFVIGGNRAVNDSVDAVFAHYLGQIAFSTGLLDTVRERAYGQEEVVIGIHGLVEKGVLAQDAANPAKYMFPEFCRIPGR